MAKKRSNRWRELKFWLLSRIAVPIFVLPLKVWMRTWRVEWETPGILEQIRNSESPRVLAVLHGGLLLFLGVHIKMKRADRVPNVTMVSPSRDGLLLGEVIARFGAYSVSGSTKARGAAGLLEMIKATKSGQVGLLAVDGPRGPRGVPRAGILTLAQQTKARLFVVVPAGRPAIQFKSWDRAQLPLPFAKVRVRGALFHDYSDEARPADELRELQELLLELMEESGCETDGIRRLEKESC